MNQELASENEIRNTVIDLIWKAIDGKIKPEQLVNSLSDIQLKYGKNFESLVVDTISIIDVEIGAFATASDNVKLINSEDDSAPVSKKDKLYSVITHLRPIVGDDLLKERLDIETLEGLKIIPKKELFNQKYIKIKTRLFYKQQKFNLLREESEGFSKLITELGPNNLNSKALENIQSLIGCFNLDPNRVLDIILESFENNLALYDTFIGLLKHYKAEEDTIGQIIGFKYQSLHQHQLAQHQKIAKETTANTSSKDNKQQPHYDAAFIENLIADKIDLSSLYQVTAHLLKHKIVDLDLLLPHLYPSDQQIQQMYKDELESARQYAKKLTLVNLADGSGQQSELQNLTLDEMNPTGSSSSSNNNSSSGGKTTTVNTVSSQVIQQLTSQANYVDNHRVCLVKACIEIGDYTTAMKLIEKMPHWFMAIQPDVATSVCQSLDANFVDKMYQRFNMLSGQLKEKYTSANKPFLNGTEDVLMCEEEESERILDDFVEKILPILCSLGPGVSYSPILFTKLVRICAAFIDSKRLFSTNSFCSTSHHNMEKEGSPPPASSNSSTKQSLEQAVKSLSQSELRFYNSILTIINDVLMPSISMLSCNPCIAIELWNLVKNFPYEMRYYVYNNWKLMTYKQFPHLIRARADCLEKIKYLLKRLTKENVKIHGRQIGKLSHNNPIIVCDYILTQIQRYDNFILPVVESLKFMTPLSYDVLSYCIIIAISDADKDKMKTDSTNISSWLQSIATFSALTFKKYPIELIAIIQCVIDQLKLKKSCDLLILQEIVQKMSGIEVLSEVNDLQLEAMAGGDLLRQEAGYFNPIRNIKKCANRLKEALADHGLILPLCILLSQQRDYIVFTDKAEREKAIMMPESVEKTHLKLIGSLYDQCQDSLVQFSQFLSSTLTTEEYIHIFPKIDELVTDYHVSPDVAFFLSRPMYAHHIQSKYEEFRKIDRGNKSSESKPSKTQRYLEAIEFVMEPVCNLVRSLHSSKVWDDMSPLFYTTFWTLSMNDLYVPSTAYDKQRASLKQKLNEIDDNQDLTSAKKKKEKEKITIMMDKLQEEENKQKDHVQHVRARFEKEKDLWFPEKNKTKNETITVFLQLCIFSRCLFTQIDAYYCAKFIQIIHSLKTPNFSTIICYDRIFSDISYSVASLTENEARRYGRFLLGLLETVMSWHADSSVFDAECSQHPGFLTVFRNMPHNNATTTNGNKLEQLDYENFRHVCHKWHYKLTKCFIVCLQSEEYIQMRNSLIILTKIASHYPKLTGFATALEKQVEKIKQKERDKRQDIFTLASAYLGQLKLRKSSMMEESKFHMKEEKKPVDQGASSASKPSSVSTPKSSLSSSLSKANAPSKESSNKSTSGNPSASSSTISSNTSGTSLVTNSSSSTNGSTQSTSPNLKSSQQNGKDSSAKDAKSTTSSTKSAQSSTSSSSQQSSSSHQKTSSSSSSSSRQVQSSSNVNTNVTQSPRSSSPTPSTPSRVTSTGSANGSSQNHRESRDYSPTSSVSSDEALPSPKPVPTNRQSSSATNVSTSESHHHHHNGKKAHSRSSSPQTTNGKVANGSNQQSNSSVHTSKSSSSSNSSSDKAKRQKLEDSYSKSNDHQGGSSTRRKSRERANNEKTGEERKDERKVENNSSNNKDKKDHRKRELSNDSSEAQRKRSKSDEAKKKTGSSQPSGVSSSSSSSRSRGGAKKDGNYDDKDDYQSQNQSSSSSSQPISSSSSGRHRDDRKGNNDKHYYKDKK